MNSSQQKPAAKRPAKAGDERPRVEGLTAGSSNQRMRKEMPRALLGPLRKLLDRVSNSKIAIVVELDEAGYRVDLECAGATVTGGPVKGAGDALRWAIRRAHAVLDGRDRPRAVTSMRTSDGGVL